MTYISYIVSDTSVCSIKCWKISTETVTCWQCGNSKNYIIPVITSFLFVFHLTVWQSWRAYFDDVHWKNPWRSELVSSLW